MTTQPDPPPKAPPTMSVAMTFASPATTFAFGIDRATGSYHRPPQSTGDLAFKAGWRPVAVGFGRDPRDGIDPDDLADAGWGVVWTDEATRDVVRPHLAPLLDARRQQSEDRYFESVLQPSASVASFLRETGGLTGLPADPGVSAPYYLLLVGDPSKTSFEFQQQLDLRYAVGRLHFDRLESYDRYANAVLEAEHESLRGRRMQTFAAQHDDDPVTELCVDQLIRPLTDEAARSVGWSVEPKLGPAADGAALRRMLADSETSLLVTAAHSPVLSIDEPKQRSLHGAIITSRWPGPRSGVPVADEDLFGAADVEEALDLRGLVAVLVGCFSGGTPRVDAFAEREPIRLADKPYVAALPQALLDRGALAAITHVDSLYLHSFAWPGAGRRPQHQTFGDMLARLRAGRRVGHAMDPFGRRYSELAAHLLAARLEPGRLDAETYAAFWIAYHDARQYVILGDPAVRLSVEPDPPLDPSP